jgi:hypothetical protein
MAWSIAIPRGWTGVRPPGRTLSIVFLIREEEPYQINYRTLRLETPNPDKAKPVVRRGRKATDLGRQDGRATEGWCLWYALLCTCKIKNMSKQKTMKRYSFICVLIYGLLSLTLALTTCGREDVPV